MAMLKVNRGFNWFVFLLLIVGHLLFLISIFRQSIVSNGLLFYPFFTLSTVLLIAGYYAIHKSSDVKVEYRAQHHTLHNELSLVPNDFILILSSIVGAILTHIALISLELPAVLLASGIALFVGSLLHLIKSDLFKGSDFAFYAGVFVGCTNLTWSTENLWFIALGGLVVGFLFVFSKNILIGVGGRLGTFAFLSVWLVDYLVSKL